MIENYREAIHATMALQEWFKSQDIKPNEAIIVCLTFVAEMIKKNAKKEGESSRTLSFDSRGALCDSQELKRCSRSS